jgi:MoxR-like ATPase
MTDVVGDGGCGMIQKADAERFAATFDELAASVAGEVFGKDDQIRLALICLLSRGHLLIEDYPGVAKTSLARALGDAIGGTFRRIQFTADLLPADVTGGMIYKQRSEEFDFVRGPVFTNVLLADEINRAAPRTQAALLEAMGENQVTVQGRTWELEQPFVCIATQNPIEMYGTYALPEAQLDRFAVRMSLGYPDVDAESRAIARGTADHRPRSARQVLTTNGFNHLADLACSVHLAPAARDYVARIAAATRGTAGAEFGIRIGVSPRGSIALAACAAVSAVSRGAVFVTGDDIVDVAVPVLAHRILLMGDAEGDRGAAEEAVAKVVAAVRPPKERLEPTVV